MEDTINLASPRISDRNGWTGKGTTYFLKDSNLPYSIVNACTEVKPGDSEVAHLSDDRDYYFNMSIYSYKPLEVSKAYRNSHEVILNDSAPFWGLCRKPDRSFLRRKFLNRTNRVLWVKQTLLPIIRGPAWCIVSLTCCAAQLLFVCKEGHTTGPKQADFVNPIAP